MNLCRCLIKISGGETSGIGGAWEQSYPSTHQASSLAIIPYVIDASFPFSPQLHRQALLFSLTHRIGFSAHL